MLSLSQTEYYYHMKHNLLLSLLLLSFIYSSAQTRGGYRPTRSDTIRKVVPPQVYGNPRQARMADSIAKAKAKIDAEEAEAKRIAELASQQEAERLRLEEVANRRNQEKLKNNSTNTNKPNANKPSPKVVPQQVYGNPRQARIADSIAKAKSEADQVEKKRMADEEAQKEAELLRYLEKQKDKPAPSPKTEQKKLKPNTNKTFPEIPSSSSPIEESNYNNPTKKKQAKLWPNQWTLNQCVEYAREHNLQVRESELNERLAKLTYEQNKASRLPSLNADMNVGESYGRSIDPTSNQFVTRGFLYNTMGLSSQALLFGWFQTKHRIEQSRLETEAAQYAFRQLKDDISLNIATGFLRVLLIREQVRISESQLQLSLKQYQQTLASVKAGKLPELNAAQMLAQLSSDSSNWITNTTDEKIALLQLKALMNFNFEDPFDIVAPDQNALQIANLYTVTTPEAAFKLAAQNQYRIKVNKSRLLSAQKTLEIARANQYPQLAAFGNIGTNFSTNVKDLTGQTYIGEQFLGNINIAGSSYPITRPEYEYSFRTRGLFRQYGDNIRANAGLGLSMPIFNGYTARTNVERAKIGLVTSQIAMDNELIRLRQDVYTAYEQAIASSQKYAASTRALESSQRAFDFASKRYEVGLINTFEYTSAQNNLLTARSNANAAKYDLLFKIKVLDYYMGNPIQL